MNETSKVTINTFHHRIRCIIKTENPDKNTDAEEWKTATSLIAGDSMVAGLRKVKLWRNKKVKVRFFLCAKIEGSYYYSVHLLKKTPDNIMLYFGMSNSPNKNKDAMYEELTNIKDFKRSDIHLPNKYIYQHHCKYHSKKVCW